MPDTKEDGYVLDDSFDSNGFRRYLDPELIQKAEEMKKEPEKKSESKNNK